MGPTSEPSTDGYSPDGQQHDLDGTGMEINPECYLIAQNCLSPQGHRERAT
jgi:hypothetical protein